MSRNERINVNERRKYLKLVMPRYVQARGRGRGQSGFLRAKQPTSTKEVTSDHIINCTDYS